MAKNENTEPKPAKVKKRRWYHQVWEIYTDVRKAEPAITWMMLGILVGAIALGAVLGSLFGGTGVTIYGGVLGLMFGLVGAMFLLSRKAQKHAYARIEGQPGAVSAVLGTVRRGWNAEQEPVAVDMRTRDMVFRAVGRKGVVLISEGPAHRVPKLLAAEKRKVLRVVPNAPIVEIQSGNEEGQVPLPKLLGAMQKNKTVLTNNQVAEISKRLRALQRGSLPIPKGVDPMRARPDRKGMKGR